MLSSSLLTCTRVTVRSSTIAVSSTLFVARRMALTQKKIFVGFSLIEPAFDILKSSNFDVNVWTSNNFPTEEEMCENMVGIHGLYTFGPQKVTAKMLEAAGPQLEVVSAMSVGVDSIDLVELKKRGIKLGHTPGVLTDAVAELTIGLLLATTRRMIEMGNKLRNGGIGKWKPFFDLSGSLHSSTVGIVGLGRIGTAVAKRLIPFGVSKIVYHSRSEKPEAAADVNATYVSFDDLLHESDFVIICCSMNESCKDLFSTKEFGKMKKSAVIVNIGRGAMIDQDALVAALQNGQIGGAGLDVTSPEPLSIDHPLFSLPNCFITPHIGSATVQTRTAMATLASKNLVAGLNGEKMPAQYPL